MRGFEVVLGMQIRVAPNPYQNHENELFNLAGQVARSSLAIIYCNLPSLHFASNKCMTFNMDQSVHRIAQADQSERRRSVQPTIFLADHL